MIVNGRKTELKERTGLEKWLTENGYDVSKTAVLLNGDVVPRDRRNAVYLTDGDCLEIVSFVGGG